MQPTSKGFMQAYMAARNRYPKLSSEEVGALIKGDPAILAQAEAQRSAVTFRQDLNASFGFMADHWGQIMAKAFLFFAFNIFWLLFMPKTPIAKIVLHWLIGN